MRVLIVPDKFKGTLIASDAAKAIASGWYRARPNDRIVSVPMSDGGDGFGSVMGNILKARRQSVHAVDAAHRPCKSHWWWQPETKTAVIESATSIGLTMLPPKTFHPFQLDTSGLGYVLLAAKNKGAMRFIIGLGGSATNDGGFGMACALGWRFLDSTGGSIERWIELDRLERICLPALPEGFRQAEIVAASDVENPLLGESGATRIYGQQKGLQPADFATAERALERLACIARKQFKHDLAKLPGAGAAGGLGFGLAAFLGARFESGFEVFADLSGLTSLLREADLVITAEGRIDSSSLMGKGTGQLADLCRNYKVPCIGLAGCVSNHGLLKRQFVKVHVLTDLTTPESAMAKPGHWLRRLASLAAKEWDEGSPPARRSRLNSNRRTLTSSS